MGGVSHCTRPHRESGLLVVLFWIRMLMNRRGFLLGMLAAGAAPAIVKAANIMPIFVRKEVGGLLVPGWPAEMQHEQYVVTEVSGGSVLLAVNVRRVRDVRVSHKQ